MKKITALIFFFFFVLKLFSQVTINRIGTYEFSKEIEVVKTVILKMPYGKANIVSVTGDTSGLGNAGDILIDIICTDFPSTSDLNSLNRKRLKQFYRLFPYISPLGPKITIIRQMDGNEKIIAQDMFHGLLIKFRPVQTKETMIDDVAKLEQIINLQQVEAPWIKIADSTLDSKTRKKEDTARVERESLSPSIVRVKSRLEFDYVPSYSIAAGRFPKWLHLGIHDSSCYVVLTPKDALKQGYITRKEYKFSDGARGWKAQDFITILHCKTHHESDSLNVKDEVYLPELDSTSITNYSLSNDKQPLPDSTLIKIFNRNKWTRMDIVGDVTGSMYPYTAQLLIWLKLQSLDSLTTDYSFFNDGNNMPDKKKKIGKTGGIYSQKCTSFTAVLNLVKETMLKGGGGDCPENNIEALLQADKTFPDVDFHILIADNWASIKDMSIASQISKPIRVVLCGVSGNLINTDYLDLARLTKGSVHLMEKDLFNLATMHEGEVLTIGRKEYKIINGRFKDISTGVQQRL